MQGSIGVKVGAAALAMATVGLTACGSGAVDKPAAQKWTPSASTNAVAAVSTVGLERFLMVRGEEPGFQPAGPPNTVADANQFASDEGRPQSYVRRLREEGFVALVSQPLESTHGAGITSLILFRTAEGATNDAGRDYRNVETDYKGWTVDRFDVAGMPGAFGWTATRPGDRVANVIWVEGRCVLTLGNAAQTGSAGTLVAPLTAGVQAQHRRIAGHCP
jgi:hypothetical protein